MNLLVPITLAAWMPIIFVLFLALPPRRAIIAAFVISWLFLPFGTGIKLAEGIPLLDKVSINVLGVLLCAALFDGNRLLTFRPRWFDFPIAIFSISPLFSAITMGDGWYEGLAASFTYCLYWLLPYIIARVYFNDPQSLRELAFGIILGGLAYVPLCLIEARISPQLNNIVYGYYQHSFVQTRRMGGWRPIVFMQHGLAVGMFMTTTTILAIWAASAKSIRIPWWVLAPLLVTTVLCRSLLAMVLLPVGLGALYITRLIPTRVLLIALILVPPIYVIARASNQYNAEGLVKLVKSFAGEERASSLETRLDNEDRLVERALQRPMFGWAFSGKFLIYDANGKNLTVPDGFWVIALGRNGLLGLVSAMLAILLPVMLFTYRFPARTWHSPGLAPAAAMAVILALHMIDNLMNAMLSPFFVLMMGAVSSFVDAAPRAVPQRESVLLAGAPV